MLQLKRYRGTKQRTGILACLGCLVCVDLNRPEGFH